MLGQPGTSFWADGLDLLVEARGCLHQLELVFEVLYFPAGLGQAISLIALEPGALPGVDQRLAASLVQRRVGHPELDGEVLDPLAGQHPGHSLLSELTRVAERHVHLLVGHGQFSQNVVHFLGSRSSRDLGHRRHSGVVQR